MNILEIIDAMSWHEYLVFVAIFMGFVNIIAWFMLWGKKSKTEKHAKNIASKLINSMEDKMNNRGFVDPASIMVLCVVAIAGIISYNEINRPRSAASVVETQPSGDTVIFKKKSFSYYDLATSQTVQMPVTPKPKPQPPKKACE